MKYKYSNLLKNSNLLLVFYLFKHIKKDVIFWKDNIFKTNHELNKK